MGVHDFLDPYLTHLAVGGAKREWRSPDLFMQREYIIGRFMLFNWIVFFVQIRRMAEVSQFSDI